MLPPQPRSCLPVPLMMEPPQTLASPGILRDQVSPGCRQSATWRAPQQDPELASLLTADCCCHQCPLPGPVPVPPLSREHRMKEGMSNNSTTSISQARKAVEQLKMEAGMDRVKVSQAASDLLAYCEAHVREDPLIIPVPASENPFREKKFFCTIL
ncbi:Guanine nucleotide-binding G(I) G(S) G(O) subunit gamma-4 [Sigmodon hispidus]